MALDAIPSPLRHHQLVAGNQPDGIRDVLDAIYDRVRHPSPEKFQRLVSLRIPEYLSQVSSILTQRSAGKELAVTERQTARTGAFDRTFQGEDLDLTVVNFQPRRDPEDMSGVTIVNASGDWMIEIDVESPLRGMRHAADMRFRRGDADRGGQVMFRVDSGEVARHEEVIDLATVRHEKYVVEYLVFQHVSRVAKIQVRPLDDHARQDGAFCLDSVSVYSLPRGGAVPAT
jgi:hypothetical protein